jgi:SHS2 domain-containing protein
MKKYEDVPHTGDIAFKVFGKDLNKLFENAAFALFSHIIDIEKVDKDEEVPVRVQAKDQGELLINWLNELNFIAQTRLIVFRYFSVEKLESASLSATASGETYDSHRHGPFQEIKAVTFHGGEIRKTPQGYECLIVCDI